MEEKEKVRKKGGEKLSRGIKEARKSRKAIADATVDI